MNPPPKLIESRQESVSRNACGLDMIVTGIPRSGTSYFTSALHRVENCVAINEPEEIFRHLDDTGPTWGLASYYCSLREEIGNGRPERRIRMIGNLTKWSLRSDELGGPFSRWDLVDIFPQ